MTAGDFRGGASAAISRVQTKLSDRLTGATELSVASGRHPTWRPRAGGDLPFLASAIVTDLSGLEIEAPILSESDGRTPGIAHLPPPPPRGCAASGDAASSGSTAGERDASEKAARRARAAKWSWLRTGGTP